MRQFCSDVLCEKFDRATRGKCNNNVLCTCFRIIFACLKKITTGKFGEHGESREQWLHLTDMQRSYRRQQWERERNRETDRQTDTERENWSKTANNAPS